MRDQASLRKSRVPDRRRNFVISFSPHSTTYITFLGSLWLLLWIALLSNIHTPWVTLQSLLCLVHSFSNILVYIRISMPRLIYPSIMNTTTTMATLFEVEVEP